MEEIPKGRESDNFDMNHAEDEDVLTQVGGFLRKDHYVQHRRDVHMKEIPKGRGSGNFDMDHAEDEGLPTQLYMLCLNTLKDLCFQGQHQLRGRAQSLLLREELMKLYLWGEGFGPGELETALEYSDDTRYIVLDILGGVGHLILRGKNAETQRGCFLVGSSFCLAGYYYT
jgi:hypothetical protein